MATGGSSSRARADQMLSEFFAKSCHVILDARIPVAEDGASAVASAAFSPSESAGGQRVMGGGQRADAPGPALAAQAAARGRTSDRWFNLELKRNEEFSRSVEAWRREGSSTMIVDIILQQPMKGGEHGLPSPNRHVAAADWVQAHGERREPGRADRGAVGGGVGFVQDAGKRHGMVTVLERWVVHFERRRGTGALSAGELSRGIGRSDFGGAGGLLEMGEVGRVGGGGPQQQQQQGRSSSTSDLDRAGTAAGGSAAASAQTSSSSSSPGPIPQRHPRQQHHGRLGMYSAGIDIPLDIPGVYKHMVLMLRSLYCTTRALPAFRLFRLASQALHEPDFSLSFHVSSDPTPLTEQDMAVMSTFHLTPVETQTGRVRISVAYRHTAAVTAVEVSPPIIPRIITDYVGSPSTESVRRYARNMPLGPLVRRGIHIVPLVASSPPSAAVFPGSVSASAVSLASPAPSGSLGRGLVSGRVRGSEGDMSQEAGARYDVEAMFGRRHSFGGAEGRGLSQRALTMPVARLREMGSIGFPSSPSSSRPPNADLMLTAAAGQKPSGAALGSNEPLGVATVAALSSSPASTPHPSYFPSATKVHPAMAHASAPVSIPKVNSKGQICPPRSPRMMATEGSSSGSSGPSRFSHSPHSLPQPPFYPSSTPGLPTLSQRAFAAGKLPSPSQSPQRQLLGFNPVTIGTAPDAPSMVHQRSSPHGQHWQPLSVPSAAPQVQVGWSTATGAEGSSAAGGRTGGGDGMGARGGTWKGLRGGGKAEAATSAASALTVALASSSSSQQTAAVGTMAAAAGPAPSLPSLPQGGFFTPVPSNLKPHHHLQLARAARGSLGGAAAFFPSTSVPSSVPSTLPSFAHDSSAATAAGAAPLLGLGAFASVEAQYQSSTDDMASSRSHGQGGVASPSLAALDLPSSSALDDEDEHFGLPFAVDDDDSHQQVSSDTGPSPPPGASLHGGPGMMSSGSIQSRDAAVGSLVRILRSAPPLRSHAISASVPPTTFVGFSPLPATTQQPAGQQPTCTIPGFPVGSGTRRGLGPDNASEVRLLHPQGRSLDGGGEADVCKDVGSAIGELALYVDMRESLRRQRGEQSGRSREGSSGGSWGGGASGDRHNSREGRSLSGRACP